MNKQGGEIICLIDQPARSISVQIWGPVTTQKTWWREGTAYDSRRAQEREGILSLSSLFRQRQVGRNSNKAQPQIRNLTRQLSLSQSAKK